MTNGKNNKGFLQAGKMAKYLDISKGTLASWRKQGKIRASSYIEPSDGLFLYEIEPVLEDLRRGRSGWSHSDAIRYLGEHRVSSFRNSSFTISFNR